MSQFGIFLEVGVRHILNLQALDHLLFLLVLVAPYRLRDWRRLVAVASAFTVGHSLTLALVVTGTLAVPTRLVEFLIPVTIVLAGIECILRSPRPETGWVRAGLAAGFGLIHGAGFASVLKAMFDGPVALPLLAFNLGIELGQLVVLAAALLTVGALDRMLRGAEPGRGLRARAVVITAAASVVAAAMASTRSPW